MSFKHLREMMLLKEAGPGFFSEAKHYNDSGEFTDEFYEIFHLITKIKKIMKHPKWIEYMKTTDRNFDTSTEGSARDAIRTITDLEDCLTEIDREFDRVNGEEPQARRREQPEAEPENE